MNPKNNNGIKRREQLGSVIYDNKISFKQRISHSTKINGPRVIRVLLPKYNKFNINEKWKPYDESDSIINK